MSTNRRKTPRPSGFVKQVIDIVDKYVAETGNRDYVLEEVAAWARINGLLDAPQVHINKMLASVIRKALRQDFTSDENGEPVRLRHAYKEKRGDKQLTFWFKMSDATPEKMRLSAHGRRNGSLMDILQLDRDVRYFDKHYNPGDPIEMDYNFNPDVEERRMPDEYPDAPPPGNDD